jgi:hypothetical protein
VFQNKDTPVNEVVDIALRNLHDYHHHTIKPCFTPTNLKPPSIDGHNNNWNPPLRNLLIWMLIRMMAIGDWVGFCGGAVTTVGVVTKVFKGSDNVALAEATKHGSDRQKLL